MKAEPSKLPPRGLHLSIRITDEIDKRLDALLPSFNTTPGISVKRSDVARAALLAGLDVLEAQRAPGTRKPPAR